MNDNWCWYHVVATTYGAWLYGDARGFRTRHHREHVGGDYKNPPPPGTYENLENRSRSLLKQAPVVLPQLRSVVGNAIRERLVGLGAQFLCIAVGGQHVHWLAKMPFGQARRWTGLAKRHVWFVLRERGWKGELWAKRSKAIVIETREHQLNAYYYILAHREEGAWVWSMIERDNHQ